MKERGWEEAYWRNVCCMQQLVCGTKVRDALR